MCKNAIICCNSHIVIHVYERYQNHKKYFEGCVHMLKMYNIITIDLHSGWKATFISKTTSTATKNYINISFKISFLYCTLHNFARLNYRPHLP